MSIAGSAQELRCQAGPVDGHGLTVRQHDEQSLFRLGGEEAETPHARERVELGGFRAGDASWAEVARSRSLARASPRTRPRRVFGKRCGSTGSVSDAMPTGTRRALCETRLRHAWPALIASSIERLAAPASIATRRSRRTPRHRCGPRSLDVLLDDRLGRREPEQHAYDDQRRQCHDDSAPGGLGHRRLHHAHAGHADER